MLGAGPDGTIEVLQPSYAGSRRRGFRLTRAPVAPAATALGELAGVGPVALDLADPLALALQGEAGDGVALTCFAESVERAEGPPAFTPVGLLGLQGGDGPGLEVDVVADPAELPGARVGDRLRVEAYLVGALS